MTLQAVPTNNLEPSDKLPGDWPASGQPPRHSVFKVVVFVFVKEVSMDRKDYEILEELLDVVEQLQQRTGGNPRRSYLSSSRKLRQDTDDFAGKCQHGELVGRARKRKSGELFRRIVALCPDVWRK
jgi:hypothetical protein